MIDLTDKTLQGLLNYLKINTQEELINLTIDTDLINQVATYLYDNNIKITFSKVSELLGINRASIYNTYPKSKQYIKILINRQKVFNQAQRLNKNKEPLAKNKMNNNLGKDIDKAKIERFMTIIMNLELDISKKELMISSLKSKILSLQDTINSFKNNI